MHVIPTVRASGMKQWHDLDDYDPEQRPPLQPILMKYENKFHCNFHQPYIIQSCKDLLPLHTYKIFKILKWEDAVYISDL